MIEDDEVNDDVDEAETETLAEGLTEETEDVNEQVHMSPPHVEPDTTTETADADHSREDPTADLPPRKRSRRDPRISGEVNVEVQTTTETFTLAGTSQPKFNYIPSELNPKIIDFVLNERAAMYMPVPKPGEGWSCGPSEADVVRAAELLKAVASQVEAAAKLKQVAIPEIVETAESSDSEDLFEENETTILMRRISTLKEDKIFKDA
ncbi:hypothetical protein HanPI659440_Chr16g0626241 [Helianthus annuus]|nr:hypothetical protein HanPI659440_Chr16g0626241 [Helianthus annuus]